MRSGLLCLLSALGLAILSGWAEAQPIGQADRVRNEVTAESGGGTRTLAVGDAVLFGDKLSTGKDARLEARLDDETRLTLGENATLTLDEFIYAPEKSGNRLALAVLGGAFLFVGGRVEGGDGQVQITTSFATLGVRGTTVWGGPLDGAYAVLVLEGEVTVTNAGSTVTLTTGEGTTIADEVSAPQPPVTWATAKVDRAIATVAFPN